MAQLLVLHGPNLNLLGTREPGLYGNTSLEQVNQQLTAAAEKAGHSLAHYQSNAEHDLVSRIHQAAEDKIDLIIFNPAAFTHTSVALRDALLATDIPLIEIHISNVFKREEFRQHSYFSDIAIGIISGFGPQGYLLALDAAINHLKTST